MDIYIITKFHYFILFCVWVTRLEREEEEEEEDEQNSLS